MSKLKPKFEQPLGRIFSGLGKEFLSTLHSKLKGLSIKRNFYALMLIDEAKEGITQQELAVHMNTDKVSIVRIIDYLSTKGYVRRVRNSDDRRKHFLVLTPKAQKEITRIKKCLNETRIIALKGLSDSRIREFYSVLDIIKRNFSEIKRNL